MLVLDTCVLVDEPGVGEDTSGISMLTLLELRPGVDAAVRAVGRTPRGRMVDLLIAATAAAHGAVVLTDTVDGFAGLEGVVELRRPSRG